MNADSQGETCEIVERCEACRDVADNGILWESLPVPAFGNHRSAEVKVATIAINPAGSEFFERDDVKTPEARLPLLRDYHKTQRMGLGLGEIKDAKERRNFYFRTAQGNPRKYYHPWFDPLELILRGMCPDWSYFTGTAVHIDIVACATKPAWRRVPDAAKKILQQNCQGHFRRTLSELPLGTILLSNGVGPEDIPVDIEAEAEFPNALPRFTIWRGTASLKEHSLPFLGWNVTAKSLTENQKAFLFAAVVQKPFLA